MKLAPAALALTFLSLMVATPFMACDDDDDVPEGIAPARPDANPPDVPAGDAGIDTGGETMIWPGTCDPVRQNCPSGQQCTGGCDVMGVMAKVFTCAVPSAGASATHGQDCGAGCAAGHDCFAVPSDGGARNVCRKYCNTSADCPNTTCAAEGLICTAGDTNPIGRVCAL